MILTKNFLVSCMVVMSLFSFTAGSCLAEETAANPDVYGSWELLTIERAGMTIELTLIINAGEIISSNTCSFQDYSVLAEVSSSAVITSDEIRVLESKKVLKEHSPGFLRCNASVKEGNMQYQVAGDKLVLTMEGRNETVELTRIAR